VLLVLERLHEMPWSKAAFIGIRLEASEAGRVTWRLSFILIIEVSARKH